MNNLFSICSPLNYQYLNSQLLKKLYDETKIINRITLQIVVHNIIKNECTPMKFLLYICAYVMVAFVSKLLLSKIVTELMPHSLYYTQQSALPTTTSRAQLLLLSNNVSFFVVPKFISQGTNL